MFPKIKTLVKSLDHVDIHTQRLELLDKIIAHIQKKVDGQQAIYLNFICTHNSRRSHLAQIWSQVFSKYYDVPLVFCFSGGTEETAVHSSVINTLKDQGFELCVRKKKSENPKYYICYSDEHAPIVSFSKKYDHPFNPRENFTAVMTCGHADENCPLISGASHRFVLTYIDPKISDGTDQQAQTYMNRSLEIAREANYIFSNIQT